MMEPSKSFPKLRELLVSVKKQKEKIESTPEMTGVATCSGSTDISKMRLQANCACGEKRWHHVSIDSRP